MQACMPRSAAAQARLRSHHTRAASACCGRPATRRRRAEQRHTFAICNLQSMNVRKVASSLAQPRRALTPRRRCLCHDPAAPRRRRARLARRAARAAACAHRGGASGHTRPRQPARRRARAQACRTRAHARAARRIVRPRSRRRVSARPARAARAARRAARGSCAGARGRRVLLLLLLLLLRHLLQAQRRWGDADECRVGGWQLATRGAHGAAQRQHLQPQPSGDLLRRRGARREAARGRVGRLVGRPRCCRARCAAPRRASSRSLSTDTSSMSCARRRVRSAQLARARRRCGAAAPRTPAR
jgi:hypothetical protein